MKKLFTLLPLSLSLFLIIIAFSTTIIWKPTDPDAALAWNLAIILAPVFALMVQWKFAKERQLPIVLTLTVLAIMNTALILGSRLGAWKGCDWLRALTGGGLPDLPGKTVMGGLALMLIVFAMLRRFWRLPLGMADVLVLGLPLAAVVARSGCLFAGCCYGVPTNSDWGICYGPGTPAYMHQTALGLIPDGASSTTLLFPVQLFLIACNLLIFAVVWHFRKRFARPGSLAFLALGLLTLQRFGFEFLRDLATNRGAFGAMWGGLKAAQWMALLLAVGSIAGFIAVQFFQKSKPQSAPLTSHKVGIAPQAYALGAITFVGFLLRDLLTLDEAMVILVSCIPALLVLGRELWREHHAGRPVWAPVSMLSATAIVVMLNPLDTIAPLQTPEEWKQWMELSGGGAFGSYKQISRDCDGNITDTDIVKANSGGGEINTNWQRGWTKLQVGLRGTFGTVHSDDNNSEDNNYRYSSLGLRGSVENRWGGVSLGVFNRQKKFPEKVGFGLSSRNEFFPSASLRLGPLDQYFVDFRLYDEPSLGFTEDIPFSMGLLNWGFKDPSGNSRIRVGFAVTQSGEGALHFGGQFPLGNEGLSGSVSVYLIDATMVRVGLRYRFKER